MANRYLEKSTIQLVAAYLESSKCPATDSEIGTAIDRNRAGVYKSIQTLVELGCAVKVKGFGAISTGRPFVEPAKAGKEEVFKTITPHESADLLHAAIDGLDVDQWREKVNAAKSNANQVKGFVFCGGRYDALSARMAV